MTFWEWLLVKIINEISPSRLQIQMNPFSSEIFKDNDFSLLNHNKIYADRLYNQYPKMTTNLANKPDSDA